MKHYDIYFDNEMIALGLNKHELLMQLEVNSWNDIELNLTDNEKGLDIISYDRIESNDLTFNTGVTA